MRLNRPLSGPVRLQSKCHRAPIHTHAPIRGNIKTSIFDPYLSRRLYHVSKPCPINLDQGERKTWNEISPRREIPHSRGLSSKHGISPKFPARKSRARTRTRPQPQTRELYDFAEVDTRIRQQQTNRTGRSLVSFTQANSGRATPTSLMDYVLKKHGRHDLYTYVPRSKSDLSYLNPRNIKGYKGDQAMPRMHTTIRLSKYFGTRLQDVLTRFLDKAAANLATTESMGHDLNEVEARTMATNKFGIEDLRHWAATILAEPVEATRLLISGKRVPSFMILLFLRRAYIPPSCLHSYIDFLSDLVADSAQRCDALGRKVCSVHFFVIASVRLLRHARKNNEILLKKVVRLIISTYGNIIKDQVKQNRHRHKSSAKITHIFNAILHLLGLPGHYSGVGVGTRVQATLQFDLLHYMNSFEPPLQISELGYHGLVRVQVNQKKNDPEMKWARLKAKSWPPWKVDKTGMDADITVEHGIARSHQIIKWMQQAGYSMPPWARPAIVYSGWDTDGSPTIQTRTTLPSSTLTRGSGIYREALEMWVARITSTATLNQAWACFLAYEKASARRWSELRSDSERADWVPKEHHPDVYWAMFKKIFAAQIDVRMYGFDSELSETHPPGDTSRVEPEPRSPYEGTAVDRPVPMPEELLEQAKREHIYPSGEFLALLLRHAPSLEFATNVFEIARKDHVRHLRAYFQNTSIESTRWINSKGNLLAAFVAILVKALDSSPEEWTRLQGPTIEPGAVAEEVHSDAAQAQLSSALSQARLRLILNHLYSNAPPHDNLWSTVFDAVGRGGIDTHLQLTTQSLLPLRSSQLLRFEYIRSLTVRLREMRVIIGPNSFKFICIFAMHAALQLARYTHDSAVIQRAQRDIAIFLRTQFQLMVMKENIPKQVQLPYKSSLSVLLATPPPNVLHHYVRALGALHDVEGIFSLVSYMEWYKEDVRGVVDDLVSGMVQFRRLIVAIRVFMERSWRDGEQEESNATLVFLIKQKVEGVPQWGGWASDAEVESYCSQWCLGDGFKGI